LIKLNIIYSITGLDLFSSYKNLIISLLIVVVGLIEKSREQPINNKNNKKYFIFALN